MADTFVDYYEFLGVDPTADLPTITAAIQASRQRVQAEMIYPDRHIWASAMLAQLDHAAAAFATDFTRQTYDAARAEQLAMVRRQEQQDDMYDDLLLIDPPYVFATGDTDLAYTVPALAHKLDADPERGLKAIRDGSIQAMLRYVGYSRPNRKRFDTLADNIDRLQKSTPSTRDAQLLEHVIVLCDATIERPDLLVDDELVSGAECEAPVLRTRPDKDGTYTLTLQHGGPRGHLFGMAWLEDDWATIISPTPASVTVKSVLRQAVSLDMGLGAQFKLSLKLPSAQLLKLSRPARHNLHVAVLLQPDGEHERQVRIVVPVELVSIPGKAAFAPPQVNVPMVFRGKSVSTQVALENKGDLPLAATFARSSAQDTTASPQMLADTGQIVVAIHTADIPFGARFTRRITYRANGDNAEASCDIVGEILPTAFQQMFRERSLWQRLAVAAGVGLSAMFLSLFTLLIGPGFFLWFIWVALIAGASAGATWWIALRIAGHMRASGVDVKHATIFPQRDILLVSGGGGAVVAFLITVLPFAASTKLALLLLLLLIIAGAWGFFLIDVNDIPTSALKTAHSAASQSALVRMSQPALKRMSLPPDAGLYAQVVVAAICALAFLWLVLDVLNASLAGIH